MKLFATTALAVSLAIPAHAQQCAPSTAVIQALSGQHGEVVIESVTAPAPNSEMVIQWHMWVNAETGSWSFTGTVDGATCLFAAGRSYQGQTVADFLYGEPA